MAAKVGLASPFFSPALNEPLLPLEDLDTDRSWQLERLKSGKRPWQWIELAVDRCKNVYGQAPCAAVLGTTGDAKCYNSWATCQDEAHFASEPFWLRLCEPVADIPRAFDFGDEPGIDTFVPLLKQVDPSPGVPEPGESLGQRSQLSAQLEDAPHHDIGFDKYALERITGEASVSAGEVDFDFLRGSIVAVHGRELASITFTRAGVATRVNNLGLIETVAANVPRFDYDPVTRQPKGLLIEWTSTTRVGNSVYDAGTWSNVFPTKATVTTGIDAPDGSNNAVRFTCLNNGNALLRVSIPSFTPNGTDPYSLTFYCRKVSGSGNAFTDLEDGNPAGFYQSQLITGQWVRVTMIGVPTNAAKTFIDIFSDNDTNYVLDFWGLGLELGDLPTSYIPSTAGSTTARGAELPVVLSIGGFFNPLQGTLICEWDMPYDSSVSSTFPGICGFSSGSPNDRISLYHRTSDDRLGTSIINGGVNQGDLNQNDAQYSYGSIARHAFAWKANDSAACFTGSSTVFTDTSVALPSVSEWNIGNIGGNVNLLNGHVRRLTYYPRRLPNADLVAIAGSTLPPQKIVPFTNSFDPTRQGTLLRKLKARFPHYVGRRLRWYQGYITDAPALADFRKREYVMERIAGPDFRGKTAITAKDPLKLLDNERAQAPMKSKGTLLSALTAVATPTTLDIVTTDLTEYDLKTGESVDYVRIGEEIITFTGTSIVSGNVRLSGVTRTAPSPYTTTAKAHEAGDAVQRCRYFQGSIPAVVEQLMTDYGEIDPAYIPLADWQLEADTWIAGDTIQRLVTEPEGVKSLIDEIIAQTMTWAFWFEETEQQIKFRALRPVDYTDVVKTIDDDANIAADSVKITDQPDKIINEVQVLYGQIDPVQNKDEVGNYRKGLARVDGDSQSTNELGQRRIKRTFARWHPASNAAVVERWAQRTLTARSRNLMTIEFKLERKDEDLRTADFADLTTLYLIDQFGALKTTRVRVERVDASGELVSYKAREDFFANSYGRWAPLELTGLRWTDATAEQRLRYMFWAEADGTFSNGDPGKLWL